MNIQEYIANKTLKSVTKKDFEKFYIHNQGFMNSYFPGWEEGKYYYDIEDLWDDNSIDTIYKVIDLRGKEFFDKIRYVMKEKLSADGVTIEAIDEDDKILLKYWWD